MKKFTFRLESLLKIYQKQEEDLQREVKTWIERLQNTRNDLLQLTRLQIESLKELVASQKGIISMHQLINNHDYCQALKSDIEKKQEELVMLEKILEQKQSELLEATKRRKMLEKLKEKKRAIYIDEELKLMQKELDELAGNSSVLY